VLILLAIFVIGPVAVMLGGAIWSLITGWLSTEDADLRASGVDVQESVSG
jgi:multidrug resistance efflux pump